MLRAQAVCTSRKSPSSRIDSTTVCTSYGFIGSSGTAPASSSQRRSAASPGSAHGGASTLFSGREENQRPTFLGEFPFPPLGERGSPRFVVWANAPPPPPCGTPFLVPARP